MQRFPIGTTFRSSGKVQRVCTVVDFHVTRNLAGEIVRARYVATHEFMGQTITERDIAETTIARNVISIPPPGNASR